MSEIEQKFDDAPFGISCAELTDIITACSRYIEWTGDEEYEEMKKAFRGAGISTPTQAEYDASEFR